MYRRAKVKSVVNGEDRTNLILLKPVGDPPPKFINDILTEYKDAKLVSHTIELTYDSYTAEDAMKVVLPSDVPPISSFEVIGHIAHLNLNEIQTPYASVIGRIILDKHSAIRTVINKTGTIENEFRTFPYEVIAGEANTETEVVFDQCAA